MDAQQLAAVQLQVQQQVQQQVAAALQQHVASLAALPPANPPHHHAPHVPRMQPRLHTDASYAGSAALDAWLARIEQLCNFYGVTGDGGVVAYAAAHFAGAALQWWVAQGLGQPQTWSGLVAALRARFQPLTSAEMARSKLRTLKQGHGPATMQAYVSTFNALLAHVPAMDVGDRVFAFIEGLNDRVKAHVDEVAHTTLESAIERAVRYGSRVAIHSAQPASASASSSMMDLSMLGIEGLEPETGAADNGGGQAADMSAPVTRAEFQQLLMAMQQQRSLGGSSSSSSSASGMLPRRSRFTPHVQGVTDAQIRERLDSGACLACGEQGHRKIDCPSFKQQSKNGSARRGRF
jgi:Retrotransposon gag protein